MPGSHKSFGLVSLRKEGAIAHPDIYDNVDDASDKWYLRQLQGYKDWAGDHVYETWCSRPHLLEKLT